MLSTLIEFLTFLTLVAVESHRACAVVATLETIAFTIVLAGRTRTTVLNYSNGKKKSKLSWSRCQLTPLKWNWQSQLTMDKSKDKTPRKDFGEKVSDISLGNEQTHEGLIIYLYILQNFWDNTQYLPWQIFLANFFAKYSSNPFQLLKAMK